MFKRIVRSFLLILILAAVGFFVFAPGYVESGMNKVTMPEEGWPVSEEATKLHDNLIIGDWHADSLLWDRNLLKRGSRGHTDIPRLQDGNVALQVYTAVTKSPRGQNYEANSSQAADNITPLFMGQLRPIRSWFSLQERALVQAEALADIAEESPEEVQIILTREDLSSLLDSRETGNKIVGIMLGSEGGHPLEGNIANLDVLYDAGYRLMGLTHFFDNELGGSLHGEGGSGAGLSEFGFDVVREMQAKSMIIDLAHASPEMVQDVLAIEGTRPILSHTGIQSHCSSHRNLDDTLMKQIAARGGVVGIGYWADVVCGDTPADITGAIKAAIALLGEDHVSLGSDYDGSVTVPFDAAHISALTQALIDAGLSETQITKVMGGNMMRFLAENLP